MSFTMKEEKFFILNSKKNYPKFKFQVEKTFFSGFAINLYKFHTKNANIFLCRE